MNEKPCVREKCELPQAKGKYAHTLYVCECGQAWQAVRDNNYAGNGWGWARWPR